MKKYLIPLFIVLPSMLIAQVKPNLSKAEVALRAGKIDEAKTIIDVTTASQDFMVDKKGNPTKNAAEAWYVKGLVYFAMDTTSKQEYKNLDPNPYDVGKESFEKAFKLEPDNGSLVKDKDGFPMLIPNVNAYLANSYFTKAISAYNDQKDMKAALDYSVKTLYFVPTDTTVLFYSGGIFAPGAGDYDQAIALMDRYIKAEGKNPVAYTTLASYYADNKKDHDKAIAILKEGQAKYPNFKDMRMLELNIYLGQKKYDVAKKMVEAELAKDPGEKENHFLYAQLSRELGESENAKNSYKKVLELDPKHSEAANSLAGMYWADAKKIKDEMNMLGNKKEDLAKKFELDKQFLEKLKIYKPYIEAAEKISPDDIDIQYQLLTLYEYLDEGPNMAKVKKKLKALGAEVN